MENKDLELEKIATEELKTEAEAINYIELLENEKKSNETLINVNKDLQEALDRAIIDKKKLEQKILNGLNNVSAEPKSRSIEEILGIK